MLNRKSAKRWSAWTAACVAAALLILPGVSRGQAPQALVDVTGSAQHKDPHPTTYLWEGEDVAIKEPIQYYTYFYTGTVNPNATVPLGVEIKRVAIAINDWEAQKEALITRLASFYEQAYAGGGTASGAKKQVVFDENFNYVETGGAETKSTGAIDPRAAAEWAFYYDQFVLWQYYCRRVLLNERDAVEASSSRDELQMAADLAALEGVEGVDINEVLKAAQEIRGQNEPEADAKAPGAPGKAAKKPAPKTPTRGGAGKGSTTAPQAEKLELTVATVFDPEADYADPKHNLVFREEFIRLAEQREKRSVSVFTDMLARIDERASEMQRYNEWLEDRRGDLVEFTEAWGNVRSGQTIYMNDVFYLITDEKVEQTPRDAVNIVVREAVTPQDLLEADGSLKQPPAD